MNNIEYLKEKLQKNPNILKKVISFDDILDFHLYQLKHFLKLYEIKQHKYKYVNLSLHDYHSFKLLYKTLITITQEDKEAKEMLFSDLSTPEKESFLLDFNIKYEYVDNFLIAYPKNFKETKLIGSPAWCISRSEQLWNQYNKNNSHCILFGNDEVIGVSYSDAGYQSYNLTNTNVKLNNNIYGCVIHHLGIPTKEKNNIMSTFMNFCENTLCLYTLFLIPVINIIASCLLIVFVVSVADDLLRYPRNTLKFLSIIVLSSILSLILTPFAKSKDIIYTINIPYTELHINFYDPIYSFSIDDFLSDSSLKSSFILDDTTKLKKAMIKYDSPILVGKTSITFIINHKSYKILSYILSNPEKFYFYYSRLLGVIEDTNDIQAFNVFLESDKNPILNLQKHRFDMLLSHDDNVILSKILSLNDGISMISHDAIDIAFSNNNIEGALMLIDYGHLNLESHTQTPLYFSDLLITALQSNNIELIDKIHLKMKELKFQPTSEVLEKAIMNNNLRFINKLDLSSYTLDSDYQILLDNLLLQRLKD